MLFQVKSKCSGIKGKGPESLRIFPSDHKQMQQILKQPEC